MSNAMTPAPGAQGMTMVEIVARALQPAYGDMPATLQAAWRGTAYAAIEAMREPTAAMLTAGMEEEGVDLASEYRAMIDAALKEQP